MRALPVFFVALAACYPVERLEVPTDSVSAIIAIEDGDRPVVAYAAEPPSFAYSAGPEAELFYAAIPVPLAEMTLVPGPFQPANGPFPEGTRFFELQGDWTASERMPIGVPNVDLNQCMTPTPCIRDGRCEPCGIVGPSLFPEVPEVQIDAVMTATIAAPDCARTSTAGRTLVDPNTIGAMLGTGARLLLAPGEYLLGAVENEDLKGACSGEVRLSGSFTNSRLTSVRLVEARVIDGALIDARTEVASFEGSELRRVTGLSVGMIDSDATDVRFERVVASGSVVLSRFDCGVITGANLEVHRGSSEAINVGSLTGNDLHVGRLIEAQVIDLERLEAPELVIDATDNVELSDVLVHGNATIISTGSLMRIREIQVGAKLDLDVNELILSEAQAGRMDATHSRMSISNLTAAEVTIEGPGMLRRAELSGQLEINYGDGVFLSRINLAADCSDFTLCNSLAGLLVHPQGNVDVEDISIRFAEQASSAVVAFGTLRLSQFKISGPFSTGVNLSDESILQNGRIVGTTIGVELNRHHAGGGLQDVLIEATTPVSYR